METLLQWRLNKVSMKNKQNIEMVPDPDPTSGKIL